jgi:hypothetical protein
VVISVLRIRSDRVLLQREILKKKDTGATYHFHTNKCRSLLAALCCHAFPNTCAEKWDAELVNCARGYNFNWSLICRITVVCKTSLIELKHTEFHRATTCFKCVIISLSQQFVMHVPKTAEFLSQNRISELIWDSESRNIDPERQQLWGRGRVWRRARGVTPATRPTCLAVRFL